MPRIALAVVLAATPLCSQEQDARRDAGRPQDQPAASHAAAASVAEGRALLASLVQAQAKMAQMTADYVQYRSSPLTKKPLVAKGTLAFRRQPGCVVFRVREPRESVIRLDEQHHEVWQPDKNRLERYVLPSAEMSRMLFDALAPTDAKIGGSFTIASCEPVANAATQRQLSLVPTDASARRVATRITLTIDQNGPVLRGFGYQDPRGGDVRVELSNLQQSAKADDALFSLAVPKDAQVVVQQVPAAKAAEDAGKAPAGDKR